MGDGVLAGLRVVELGVWVAGPAAGALMADWGADVVKVEPPAGDPFRAMFAATGYSAGIPNAPFGLDNRGKRSVVLDLRTEAAQAALRRLLDSADVFLTNLRLQPLERLGLLPEPVLARHPRLVYALLTGHGSSGPDRDRPGYDIGAFGARSGLAYQAAPGGEPPVTVPRGLGDHVTALALLAGVLAALRERDRGGQGQLVETSLLRAGIYTMGWDLAIQLALGKVAGTPPRSEALTPTANSYRAGDGRWFWLLGVEADRHFPRLAAAIGRPELADDPRFATARERRRHRREVIEVLDRVFALRPFDDWVARFDRHDVWWSPVQAPEQVVADPQARAVGAFRGDASGGTTVAGPVDFSAYPHPPATRVPALGEHTAQVLRELGYPEEELADFSSDG